MKKFLYLFVAVLMAGTLLADESETINFANQGYSNGQTVDEVVGNKIHVWFINEEASNPSKYYDNGTAIRVYSGGKIKISFATYEEYTLTGITFTFGDGDGMYGNDNEIIPAIGLFDGTTWSGNRADVTFQVGGKSNGQTGGYRRIKAMTFRFKEGAPEPTSGIDPTTHIEAYLGIGISTLGRFVRNPDVNGEWMLIYPRKFAANEEIMVRISNYAAVFGCAELDAGCSALSYYPKQNEYCYIEQKGWHNIYFRPNRDGGEDWCRGCIKMSRMSQAPDPTNCYEASLFVGQEDVNVAYNNGKTYTLEGYVTSIQEAYQDKYHNMSFWISDEQGDTRNILEVFRAQCPSSSHAVVVGDKVRVTGSLMKYNNIVEFVKDCTYTILNRSEDIDNTSAELKTVKTIENGQLLIERNGVIYNAQGAVVK